MRVRRSGPIALLVALSAAAAACGGDSSTTGTSGGAGTGAGTDTAAPAVTLAEIDGSGVSGTARLTASGGRIRGTITVTGLTPNTEHAMHIHGVAGENHGCAADQRTDEHLVNLPDVEADANGTATVTVDEADPGDAVRVGVYLMVHENATDHSHGTTSTSDDDASSGPRVIFAHSTTPNRGVACGEFR